MPKRAVERSALEVKRLKEPGLHAVGGTAGLYLQINPTGARSWILRVRTPNKRRRELGLGSFYDVTLAEAREQGRELRKQILGGIDPVLDKKQKKSALFAASQKEITFEKSARAYLDSKSIEWQNAKHRQQWINTLECYAFPIIGNLQIMDVELPHIMQILTPIWHAKTETATRLRGRIERILDWATVSNYRTGPNPARWKGHLDSLLPSPNKISKALHHPAVSIAEIPGFVKALKSRDGMSARALEFLILTATRSGEVRGAKWDEFDFETGIWTIPPERMKGKKEHRVPLSSQAVKIVKAITRVEGIDFVFSSPRGQKLSDMSLSAVMRRMQSHAVPHGFRSSFRDWVAEKTEFPRDLAEMALAHTIESKVESAYRRGDMLDRRLPMMVEWSSYCHSVK